MFGLADDRTSAPLDDSLLREQVFEHPARYQGELAILFDLAARQGRGRGIFVIPATRTTRHDACIMALQGRGVLTVTLLQKDTERLNLGMQGSPPKAEREPYYAVSVEAVDCVETGISAEERSLTMRVVGNPKSGAESIVSPGHIMVQVARDAFRPGASLPELGYRLISLTDPAGAVGWCDILGDDGDLAGLERCVKIAKDYALPLFNARDVILYSRHREQVLDEFSAFTYSSFM